MHERMHVFGFGVIFFVCVRLCFFFWSLYIKKSVLTHIKCQCVYVHVCLFPAVVGLYVCKGWSVDPQGRMGLDKWHAGCGQESVRLCVYVAVCLDSLSCVCVCVHENLLLPAIPLAAAESGLPPQLPALATAVTQGQLSHGEGQTLQTE